MKANCNFPFRRKAPNRLLRVAELIRRELLVLLRNEVRDPRIHRVVITRVRVSPDLSAAKVYVSLTSDEQDQQRVLAGLHHAAGFLRSALGARLNLRLIPKLFFIREAALQDEQRTEN